MGAVVLLHGLTDAPFSQRHIGELYRERGFVAIIPRLPGARHRAGGAHRVEWEDWPAATRLAVREARRRVGPGKPLHLVGFSNGGALAMQYALDAIENPELTRPDRLVLISPMIGITEFARFAGIAGWPAFFPAFAKAAWLACARIHPVQVQLVPGQRRPPILPAQPGAAGPDRPPAARRKLGSLAPILTFQSVIDFTVSTRAIITALYAQLPANGSELVLFDMNRTIKFGPLLGSGADTVLNRVLPPPPRRFRTTILANAAPDSDAMVERVTEAGATTEASARSTSPIPRACSPCRTSPCRSRSTMASMACAPTPRTISASISAPSRPAASVVL